MNTNSSITLAQQAVDTAHDRFLAASTAAWDDYEAALAVAQEVQDALVSAGSSVRKAYDAMQWRRNAAADALGDALAVASAEYEDAQGR